jgi:hypothetical protein
VRIVNCSKKLLPVDVADGGCSISGADPKSLGWCVYSLATGNLRVGTGGAGRGRLLRDLAGTGGAVASRSKLPQTSSPTAAAICFSCGGSWTD